MKLAEALSLRKDLHTRVNQLVARLQNNVVIQEGDEPGEDPKELLGELKRSVNQLEYYIFKINATNMQVTNEKGESLTKLLAEREALNMYINGLRNTITAATNIGTRYSRSEIKMVATIDVKVLRKRIDELSKKYRLLDMEIQSLNFKYDLVE